MFTKSLQLTYNCNIFVILFNIGLFMASQNNISLRKEIIKECRHEKDDREDFDQKEKLSVFYACPAP